MKTQGSKIAIVFNVLPLTGNKAVTVICIPMLIKSFRSIGSVDLFSCKVDQIIFNHLN
ncbi:hypothetical protein [Mucilaginibacter corticis]|uniref:hypothetical protein n=1 Tax=Mucilaginibacter corticis TaxID=2597670 RepID=UPI0016434E3E|nr:hypothetical protein [Mucilaginibacter corticis]